jgi:plasmid stabilization system protein ParE
MAYAVELTRRAGRDLEYLYLYIAADDSDSARRWFNGLEIAIQSLEVFPKRCPRAPESRIAGLKLRNLLYGDKPNVYRVVFRIDEGKKGIRVLTIRHGAMDKLLLRRAKRKTS